MWVDNDVQNWFPTLKNFYPSPFSKWSPQYRKNSTLSDIIKIWYVGPVEIIQCQESIRDIIIYPHMKCRWNRTMLNLCGIVVAILKMATGRNFSISGINSGHHYLPTYQILMISEPQYRTNSTLFDFNVLNWFPTSKNFYWSPFSKWPPQYCKNSTLFDLET
jgi:hypothetical protein